MDNIDKKVNESMRPIDNIDDLENFMLKQPCYETHVVKINEIYEKKLMSIMVPTIYEGFRSMYKKAMEYELKYDNGSKLNPDIEKKHRIELFQRFLSSTVTLSTQQIKAETNRIKASSGSADIFDSLVKAVIKSKINLMTYNVDVMRRNLIDTKYHDTVIIHDFVHSCYIEAAQKFRTRPEVFWIHDDILVNTVNVREIHETIKSAIEDAISNALPLNDILLEFLENPYHQRENIRIYNMVRKCNHNHNKYDNYDMNNKDPRHIINHSNHTINDGNAKYEMLDETINKDMDLVGNTEASSNTKTDVFGEFDISEDTLNSLTGNSSLNSSLDGSLNSSINSESINNSSINNSTMTPVTHEEDLRALILGMSPEDTVVDSAINSDVQQEPEDGIKVINFDLDGENPQTKRYFETLVPKFNKSADEHKKNIQNMRQELASNSANSTNYNSNVNGTGSDVNTNTANATDSVAGNTDVFIDDLLMRNMTGDKEVKLDVSI